jgi:Viral BACON domain
VDLPIGKREDRWWAGYGSYTTVYLPLVMVDSGHQVTSGSKTDYKAAYKKLVDTELTRPPRAEVEAYARRIGDTMRIYARVVNGAGTALSTAANDATLQALVWEDARVGVTGRIVRAASSIGISPELPPEGSFTATLETTNLAGVNWSALHTVVFADYRPGTGSAYDMLQGALAQPVALVADPGTVTVALEANDREDRSVPVRLRGPYVLNWTAVPDVSWITVSPDAGPISAQPTLTVAASRVSPGWQSGVVTFTASSDDGISLAQTVSVSAFSGPRVLRVGTATTTAGSRATLCIALSALGDENAVALSVTFDPMVLTNPSVAPGVDAGAAVLTSDTSQAAEGRLGLSLALPAGQTLGQGDVRLFVISFDTVPGAGTQTVPVRCSDLPVARTIVGADGNALQTTFLDGALVLADGTPERAPRRHLTPGAS